MSPLLAGDMIVLIMRRADGASESQLTIELSNGEMIFHDILEADGGPSS